MIEVKPFTTLIEANKFIISLIEHIQKLENKIDFQAFEIQELKENNTKLKEENAGLIEEIKRLKGNDPDPNTPSGMTPAFKKENKKGRRRKPGRKNGHEGSRRDTPQSTGKPVEHELQQCPDCSCPLGKSVDKRTRIIEDIPITKPEVTEHVINRYYCNNCKKYVEPIVTDAMPHSQIGIIFLVTSAWMHFWALSCFVWVNFLVFFQHSMII